jgi:hypothetical protein
MNHNGLTFAPVPDGRLTQDNQKVRTLWYADGRSLNALVTKLDNDGIHFSAGGTSGFIPAEELCTADRVRYGYGTRKEGAWVERVNANVAKHQRP